MLHDELSQIDLRSLEVLVTVSDNGSFSKAAIAMGVGQSTISYAIDRLRRAFNDQLFLRQANQLSETEKCQELVSHAREIVNRMHAIAVPIDFDPATAEGNVTLSCNHHERFLLMPRYIHALKRLAPNVMLTLLESAVIGKQQLRENAADIVLGPVRILGEGYFRRHMFVDHYSCLMDRSNPLAEDELTLERYEEGAHVAVTHNGQWQSLYLEALRSRDIDIKPRLIIPSHDSLELMIEGTDLIATIPHRLASVYDDRLAVRRFPIHIPIQIDMYWTERTHRSGLHKWARQLLADAAKQLSPDGQPEASASDG
ncbi:LysR family transcriptional regulator [Rhizobium leguminosarum]|uniref:LysR family transcriptional regulator n=1 Tax=Rhizobium leguminosarum TaxID=384 RepID=UPI0003FB053B|nr:LysR family transcriptional regulator [Rhizobium leguminosarum]